MSVPLLNTPRLDLRPFTLDDAPEIVRLAGDARIAATTARIPHPYGIHDARNWVTAMPIAAASGRLSWAIVDRMEQRLVGAIDLKIEPDRPIGLLGYWIGAPFWGHGFATEAGRVVVAFGFGVHELDEIRAIHLTRNPASGRVLEKLGMAHDGSSVDIVRGELEAVERWRVVRSDWESA